MGPRLDASYATFLSRFKGYATDNKLLRLLVRDYVPLLVSNNVELALSTPLVELSQERERERERQSEALYGL